MAYFRKFVLDVAAPVFRPFFMSCMRRRFLLMRASFVMLLTTQSDARARKGVSFYLSACRFPVFLYTNCTSVYLVWQIHFFSDLEMYYACGFVIKAMIICSSQMGVLDFGPALAYWRWNIFVFFSFLWTYFSKFVWVIKHFCFLI